MLDMRTACAAFAALLVLVGNLCLTVKVRRGLKLPILTWILWLIVLPPIATTAVLRDGWDVANGASMMDALGTCITIAVMWRTGNWRRDYPGDEAQQRRQQRIDRCCMALAVFVVVFWVATGGHLAANIALQAVLTIAYYPMWRSPAGQPIWFWCVFSAQSVVSLYPAYCAYEEGKLPPFIYAWRAVACTTSMLVLTILAALRRRRELPAK